MVLNLWSGTYNGRFETNNKKFDAAFNAQKSTNLLLVDNVVAGSERMGFSLPGESCTAPTRWSGNVAHSVLIGIGLFPDDIVAYLDCISFNGFTIYRAVDFAFLYLNNPSVKFNQITLVDNGIGFLPFVIGPDATSHSFASKFVEFTNSLIVGTSPEFDCNNDIIDQTPNIQLNNLGKRFYAKNRGRIGYTWPSFTSGTNGAPFMPFIHVGAYNSIKGVMRTEGKIIICTLSSYIL